jgi:hypothetical protein
VPQIFLNSEHVGGFEELFARFDVDCSAQEFIVKSQEGQTPEDGPEQDKQHLRCHVQLFRNGRSLPSQALADSVSLAPAASWSRAECSLKAMAVRRRQRLLKLTDAHMVVFSDAETEAGSDCSSCLADSSFVLHSSSGAPALKVF